VQALVKFPGERACFDLENPRGTVVAGGADRNLPALPRARRHAQFLQRQRHQAAGDLLTGGDHRIILTGII
jgi:hypothetical protein